MGREHRGSGQRSNSPAQLQRDAALHRVSRTRRGMILGAAALTAGFAAVVSAIAPGKSLGPRGHTSAAQSAATTAPARTSTRMPPLASASVLGLRGPAQAPQAAPAQSQGSSSQAAAQAQQSQAPGQAAPPQAPAPAVSGGS